MDTCRKTVTNTKARYPLNESFDNAFWYQLQDFNKVEALMDQFRKLMVTNNQVDTTLPYFVGVASLDNHSINIILHVRHWHAKWK